MWLQCSCNRVYPAYVYVNTHSYVHNLFVHNIESWHVCEVKHLAHTIVASMSILQSYGVEGLGTHQHWRSVVGSRLLDCDSYLCLGMPCRICLRLCTRNPLSARSFFGTMYSTLRQGQAAAGRGQRASGSANAERSMHPSPTSLADTLTWERQVVPRLLASRQRRETYLTNCRQGLHIDSFFSGIGPAEVAAHTLVDDIKRRGFENVPLPSPGFAYDVAAESQLVLLNLGASSPKHVFPKIESSIPAAHWDEISKLLPKFQEDRKRLRAVSKSALRQAQKENIARMKMAADYLDKHFDAIFTEQRTAPCVKHNSDCSCSGAAPPDSFTFCVLGSVCVAWSSRGLCEGIVHESFVALLIAVKDILSALPLVVLHECVPNFPVIILRTLLGHKYRILVFPDLSPKQLGHPVERKRQWLLMTLMDSVVTTASVEQFYELFYRALAADGSIYFAATESQLMHARKAKALKRHMSDSASCRELGSVYTNERWAVYQEHIQKEREAGNLTGDNFFWDNVHHISHGPKPSSCIPCLTRNSQIASLVHDRRAIGIEHLLMQGVCTMDIPGVRPCPWLHLIQLGTLSQNELQHLAGNAMHQAVVGALMGYALATCTRVAAPSPSTERPAAPTSDDTANDDDCSFVDVVQPCFWDLLLKEVE